MNLIRVKPLPVIIIFLILHLACLGQDVSELKKKKEEAAKEIEYTTKLLNEVQKNEKTSLHRLQLLNSQISQRNQLISGINDEIKVYQDFIDMNTEVVKWFKEDMEALREEYAELVRSAYRNKNAGDPIIFLLSAENFNQAFRRHIYMKRYSAYRRTQAETIEALQSLLNEKVVKLEQQKKMKEELAGQTRQEARQLGSEKNQQNSVIQELQKQQRSLRQKLDQQRREEQQLEREIQRIIEEEARKSSGKTTPGFALTPEQKLIGDNFEQNKRRLPWPVERGVITERFGVHSHAVLNNVQVRNNGISITTEAGAKARAVFNGEVSRVFGITGGNTAVIIRHGNFLTVYSNLREVTVKIGDKVNTKQTIGTVYTDADEGNKSVLKFQIWRENQKLNPEEWIVK